MKKPRNSTILGIIGILILLVALGVTAVFAQEAEDEATPEPDSTPSEPLPFLDGIGKDFGHGGFGHHGYGEMVEGITPRDQALADALNIPLMELETAQAAVYANWLTEMVAAGYIDQDQADLMLAYNALKGAIDRHALIAQALGLSESELTQAVEEGKRLSELLEDQGLTAEGFAAAMQEAYEAAVQAEVGKSITQEQADVIISSGANIQGFGQGFGGMRGFGHRGHGFGGMQGFGSDNQSFGRGQSGFGTYGLGALGLCPAQLGTDSSGA